MLHTRVYVFCVDIFFFFFLIIINIIIIIISIIKIYNCGYLLVK